ncbi:hypothetical protein LCGC14_1045620 [marine sediment metagenome]|uniref:Uncharacterized protein n=1 Tax=marine sediment metagenome TaxID=412755 RepID=A0A0F9MQF2_9ZZZZ
MKVYTKITIDMNTGQTVEEESFDYDGPLALAYGTGPGSGGGGGGPGGGTGTGPDGPGDQGGPSWPYGDDDSKSSDDTSSDDEEDEYEKMLQTFYEMFQAISSGEYNKTGQLVGGRGNVGSSFSYMPQLQQDALSMQLAAFAPWASDYQWNNPQDTDDDSWFDSLFDAALFGGATKLFCWVAREVYGEDNKKWIVFWTWLNFKAPKWFSKLYMCHGERFAKWISDKPKIKWVIRKWMDSRISGRCSNGVFA